MGEFIGTMLGKYVRWVRANRRPSAICTSCVCLTERGCKEKGCPVWATRFSG